MFVDLLKKVCSIWASKMIIFRIYRGKYTTYKRGIPTKTNKIQGKNLELAENLQADSILKNIMIHQI